jgi:hypothetical protein
MKTAMQELMEWLDDSIPETIKEKYLEKEKEQIMNAYWEGGQDVPTHNSTVEEYYNQNYNQNK